MSQPPGAHASHANTYSHGTGTAAKTPALALSLKKKSKEATTAGGGHGSVVGTARSGAGIGGGGGSGSASGSSASSSALSSARDCCDREHGGAIDLQVESRPLDGTRGGGGSGAHEPSRRVSREPSRHSSGDKRRNESEAGAGAEAAGRTGGTSGAAATSLQFGEERTAAGGGVSSRRTDKHAAASHASSGRTAAPAAATAADYGGSGVRPSVLASDGRMGSLTHGAGALPSSAAHPTSASFAAASPSGAYPPSAVQTSSKEGDRVRDRELERSGSHSSTRSAASAAADERTGADRQRSTRAVEREVSSGSVVGSASGSKVHSAGMRDSGALAAGSGRGSVVVSAATTGGYGDASSAASTSSLGAASPAAAAAAGGSLDPSSGLHRSSSSKSSIKGSSASSSKKPKPMSKKKAKLIQEQSTLVDMAAQAEALLAEKRAIESRMAARAERERRETLHASRVAEAGRLYTEAESDVMYEREREGVLSVLEKAVYEAQQWEAYLACNPLPDVADPAQLNAFVSVFREVDESNAPHLALGPTLDACAHAEQVVGELLRREARAREEKQEGEVVRCQRYVHLLRTLSARKLDHLTCGFLTRTDEYEQGDEQAFTVSHATPRVAYGLWVHNSSRTNRIKRVEFGEMGVQIELPQSLQKARTSIRCVRTLYDSVAVVVPKPAGAPQDASASNSTSPSPPVVAAAGATVSSTASSTVASPLLRATSRPGTRGDGGMNKILSSLSLASLSGSGSGLGGLGGGDLSTASLAAPSDESLRDPVSLFDFETRPPPMAAQTHFVSLGGVMDLQQLLLPPPAKKIKSWTLRDMTPLDRFVVPVPYPSEEAVAARRAAENQGVPLSSSYATALAPLRLKFTLPSHIFLHDHEPLFGYWDATAKATGGGGARSCAAGGGETGAWKQDGVSILEFDPRTRVVSVSLPCIKPLAVIQPRALDFPYRSWSIHPVREPGAGGGASHDYPEADAEDFSSPEAHTCRIEVVGSRFGVALEVQGMYARLVSPSHPFLRAFGEEWVSPGALVQRLSEVGINVAPSDGDAGYCRKPLKSPLLIQTLHAHLALLTQIYEVSSCRHNVSRAQNAATVRVRLNRHSIVLSAAAKKRAIMDWAAAEEEAERQDQPDTSYENYPDALRERVVERDENGNERVKQQDKERESAIDAQIREMEAEETAAAEAERVRALDAKKRAEAEEAALVAAAALSRSASAKAARSRGGWVDDALPPPPVPVLTREQKYEQGFEWVTVLAELIEAPADPSLAEAAKAAAGAPGAAAKAHAAASSSASAVDRARGSAFEELPPGVLLRFTLIRGDDAEGHCDTTPLDGCHSHFSLRRCLLAYFAERTPHDLTTAMSMATPNWGTDRPTAVGNASQQFHFLPFEPITLQTQQTVRRTLNLLRPLIFC